MSDELISLRGTDSLLMVPLSAVAVGVVVQDSRGRIVAFNELALGLLGLDANELSGRTSYDERWQAIRADGSPFPGEQHPLSVSLRTGEAVDDVVMGIRTDDWVRWFNVSSRPVVDAAGLPAAVATFVDISESVSMQHVLRQIVAVEEVVLHSRTVEEMLSETCIVVVGASSSVAWVAIANDDAEQSVSILASCGGEGYLSDDMMNWSASSPRGGGSAGMALRKGEVAIVDDLATDERFGPWRDRATARGYRSCVAVPFRHGNRAAVFVVLLKVPLSSAALQEMVQIGERLEFGVADLLRARQVTDSTESVLHTMAAITEMRDPYTGGHQQRVSQLALAIGEELRLDSAAQASLRMGALLHDIGKMAVPAEILSKPGALDPIEFELVKRHAAAGEATLRASGLPYPVPEIAGQHHERLDGSGYPNGLSGGEINLFARIVAVADVVEAMVHYRPYRESLGLPAALAAIAAGAGTLFDPSVVSACERVMEAGFVFDRTPLPRRDDATAVQLL